jgi:hypothetical protein
MLETRNLKYNLNTEMSQHKQSQRELSAAIDKISKLEISAEMKNKLNETYVPKQNFQSNNREEQSLTPVIDLTR